jgi:hypothetical protein
VAGGYDLGQHHDLGEGQVPLVYRDTPFVFVHQTAAPPQLGPYWNLSLTFAEGDESVDAVCMSDGTATFD